MTEPASWPLPEYAKLCGVSHGRIRQMLMRHQLNGTKQTEPLPWLVHNDAKSQRYLKIRQLRQERD